MLACLATLTGYSYAWPEQPWRSYYDDGYLSKFSCSGVTAVSDFFNYGFMESDAVAAGRLKDAAGGILRSRGAAAHIIMIHDKSSFDIRQAKGIKVPQGYGSHFKSTDGKSRTFMAESSGGKLVHRIQCAGRALVAFVRPVLLFRDPHRGGPRRARTAAGAAPLRLQHDVALSGPWRVHERTPIHTTTGIQTFLDARDLGARGVEPDRFFYDKATALL